MNILIVAAHPDDEILGVGGTIARHIEAGDEVCVLILGEGQTSRCEKRERAEAGIVEQLHKNTLAAADVGTSSFKAGSIALYRLAGDCVSTPRGDGWTAADGFTANVAFTFAPAAKYSITMAAPADFTVTGSGVTAPDSATVDVTNASEGATVTVTVVAANAADVVTITVTGADGANIDVTKDPTSSGKNNVFTFTMPAQAVAIAGTVSDT